MADDQQRFVLYLCFAMDEENNISGSMAVRFSRSDIEAWQNKTDNTSSADNEPVSETEVSGTTELEENKRDTPQDPSEELSELMSRFRETMSSYQHLVSVGLIIMPTYRSHYVLKEIYENADKHFEVVDKNHQFVTYGITEDQFPSVNTQIRRLREIDRGESVLPGAILLSLVATFDSLVADTLRIMLRHVPERVIDSSKSIAVTEVLKLSSFDDVIGKIIENEVIALMRGSHDQQIKYIEDKLDIRIREVYDEWGEFIEIFERRNLIAHGNYIINSHYIQNCTRHGLEVDKGQEGVFLSLDERYLRRSAGRLLEFGLGLIFVLWLKHFKDSSEAAYASFHNHTYELIKDRQSRVAARLLDLALFKRKPSASDRVMKMMTVNLANAYKKLEDEEKAKHVIAGVDWSAATDDFQICIAAVQGNYERVVELMPRVAQSDMIKKSDFREWPVFDWVREEKLVRDKFQEIYGEPIIDTADEKKSDSPEGANAPDDPDSPTIH